MNQLTQELRIMIRQRIAAERYDLDVNPEGK